MLAEIGIGGILEHLRIGTVVGWQKLKINALNGWQLKLKHLTLGRRIWPFVVALTLG